MDGAELLRIPEWKGPSMLSRSASVGSVVLIALLFLASCCCCFGGAEAPPLTPAPTSKELADALRERVSQTKAAPGPFTMTVTDQELTSYIVALLNSGAGEFPARDMQIQFGDGYAEIWATFVDIAPTDIPVYVRAEIEAQQGQLVFYIVEASGGPFPLPGAMRELVSQSLSESLAELELGLRVERVEIEPGQMTLSGQVTGSLPDCL